MRNDLSFIAATAIDIPGAQKFALLAYKGERLPGQTAISISDADMNGTRYATVVFEVNADIPDNCALSCNWK